MNNDYPGVVGAWVGLIVFVVSWVYCIAEYGYLFGVGLGWLPSLIVGFLAAWLWPLLLIAIIVWIWALNSR